MSEDRDLDFCLARLRSADRDRYLAILAGPRRLAAGLVALYAGNAEWAAVAPSVREPMLGHIRLAWWREAIAEIAAGKDPRPQAVLRVLVTTMRKAGLAATDFDRLIEARMRDLDPAPFADLAELESYATASLAPLLRLAFAICGRREIAATENAALESLAAAHAMTGLLCAAPFLAREGRFVLPADLLAEADLPANFLAGGDPGDPRLVPVARRLAERAGALWRRAAWPWPRAIVPALLPSALIPARLERLRRCGYNLADPRCRARSGLDLWRLWRVRAKGAL